MKHGIATLVCASLCGASAFAQAPPPSLRFATYNSFLNRFSEGELIQDLSTPDDAQAQAVAEIIQRTRPDVILLNEFDYDAAGTAAALFQQNYLGVSQHGAAPIEYPYVFLAPSNTGIPSGFDLNNNGVVVSTPGAPGYGDDCYGFGAFPGQFAMVVLSRYRILGDQARTFQTFRWADMPGALLPDDAATPAPADFYSPEELEVFRLSSKSHWDVPIKLRGGVVHLLAAHPTPPVFDGPEDRNGLRNHDEIRFWADYVTPGAGGYIYDDAGGQGGLAPGSRFVIAGDYNADPVDGDGVPGAIDQLLLSPLVTVELPESQGGLEAALHQGGVNLGQAGNPALDTGDFSDFSTSFVASGNLHADYVLPSANAGVLATGVFWPAEGEPFFDLVGTGFPVVSSDHRLVWADVAAFPVDDQEPPLGDFTLDFLGQAQLVTGTQFQDTEVGGLSALAYDPDIDLFLALSDDRGSIDPARYYTLELDLSDGVLTDGDLELQDVVTLLQDGGGTFPVNSLDPEGLALTQGGALHVSSEGDASTGVDPFVNRFGVAGTQQSELPVPFKFLVGPGVGVRTNLAFESLTVTPSDARLFTATENALLQDGPAASPTEASPCRILGFDLATGLAGPEYLYWTDPVPFPTIPPGAFSTNGLVELLALGDTDFLALERSFSTGVGNTIRIYRVSTALADDVSAADALSGVARMFEPVAKELVLDLADLGLLLDNVEGMSFGPKLADGRRTLVLVSDNNFSPTQLTQVLAFAIEEDGAP